MNPEQPNNPTDPSLQPQVNPGQVTQPGAQPATISAQPVAVPPPQPFTPPPPQSVATEQQPTVTQPQLISQQPANFVAQPAAGTTGAPPASPKSKKKLVIAGIVVLVVLVLAGSAFALTQKKDASSSNPQKAADSHTPTEHASDSADDKVKEEEPAAQTELAINKLVGGDLGNTVTVTKMVRNFSDSDLESDEEGVLVEVKVETDGSYTGTPGESSFRLIIDGEEYRTAYLIGDTDMTKAGFTPFGSQSAKKGAPAVGYLSFAIPKSTKAITFRYHRAETKILGGEKLPAKDFDVVIVQ